MSEYRVAGQRGAVVRRPFAVPEPISRAVSRASPWTALVYLLLVYLIWGSIYLAIVQPPNHPVTDEGLPGAPAPERSDAARDTRDGGRHPRRTLQTVRHKCGSVSGRAPERRLRSK
jgi:hypothetical protein